MRPLSLGQNSDACGEHRPGMRAALPITLAYKMPLSAQANPAQHRARSCRIQPLQRARASIRHEPDTDVYSSRRRYQITPRPTTSAHLNKPRVGAGVDVANWSPPSTIPASTNGQQHWQPQLAIVGDTSPIPCRSRPISNDAGGLISHGTSDVSSQKTLYNSSARA
jgi:hypothetical protein